jgi:signal transduction histidine kinase
MGLIAFISAGLAAGAAYVALDLAAETRIRHGDLTGAFASAHDLVDHVVPIVIGALLGVCAHYFRIRARLAEAQASAERADALHLRLQRLERDQAVWVLAAAVLHELKNPLQSLGLLLDELAACDPRDPSHDDLVQRAWAQADRALGKLESLRALRSEVEPAFQRVALDRIVGALAKDVRVLAARDRLAVSFECPGPVDADADPTYVRTILENVIDNSLQALRGHEGGAITIRLGAEAGRVVVQVHDNGPGIDPAVRSTLFEPLRSTKTQGLGLGLPIARALARSMRGDLVLADEPGKVFRLELPGAAGG